MTRKIAALSIIILTHFSHSFGEVGSFFAKKSTINFIHKTLNWSNDPLAKKYLIILNPNDCGYCMTSLHYLKSDNSVTNISVALSSDLNSQQMIALRHEFNLDSSIQILFSKPLLDTLLHHPNIRNLEHSTLFHFNGNVVTQLLLKEFNSNKIYRNYHIDTSLKLELSQYFFSNIGNMVQIEKGYVAITYPKADIAYFNKNGRFISIVNLSAKELKKVYDLNLGLIPEEFVNRNNFDSSLHTFEMVMKPMGFRTIQAENISIVDNTVWAVVSGKCPVLNSETNYTFYGQKLLLKLDIKDTGICIKECYPIHTPVKPSNQNMFLYGSNAFYLSKNNELYIGYGNGKSGTFSIGDSLFLEKFKLIHDSLIYQGRILLGEAEDDFIIANDTLKNLAMVLAPVHNGSDKDWYYCHIPDVRISGKKITYAFDLSDYPFGYHNQLTQLNNDHTVESIITYKGINYFIFKNIKTNEILEFYPVVFERDFLLTGMFPNTNRINILAKNRNKEFVVGNLNLEVKPTPKKSTQTD